MDVYCEEMVLIKNSDGTYRIEVHNCPFKDLNGEEINGTIIFPRVLKDDKNSFIPVNESPKSIICEVILDE